MPTPVKRPCFRIELHRKHLNLVPSNSRTLKLSQPDTAIAQELFNACASGGGVWDHTALVRALELMANHTVA